MSKLVDKDLYSSVIKKVISKELTQKEAALKLEISDRQVRRIIVKYKTIGEEAFIHKNAGKPSHNKKIPNEQHKFTPKATRGRKTNKAQLVEGNKS